MIAIADRIAELEAKLTTAAQVEPLTDVEVDALVTRWYNGGRSLSAREAIEMGAEDQRKKAAR